MAGIPTRVLSKGLHEIQKGKCLYCGKNIANSELAHIDHFIPRARYASDDLANLVLAHQKCNLAKKNYLAAMFHLESWITRVDNHHELLQVASDAKWEFNQSRVLGMVMAIYSRLPDEMPLWLHGQKFVPAIQKDIAKVFPI